MSTSRVLKVGISTRYWYWYWCILRVKLKNVTLGFSRVPHLHPPVDEAVEQLLAAAVLSHQHQVARCHVGLVQRHDPVAVQRFEDLVLSQGVLLALGTIRHDLGHVDLARGVLAALAHHPESAPFRKRERKTRQVEKTQAQKTNTEFYFLI